MCFVFIIIITIEIHYHLWYMWLGMDLDLVIYCVKTIILVQTLNFQVRSFHSPGHRGSIYITSQAQPNPSQPSLNF